MRTYVPEPDYYERSIVTDDTHRKRRRTRYLVAGTAVVIFSILVMYSILLVMGQT